MRKASGENSRCPHSICACAPAEAWTPARVAELSDGFAGQAPDLAHSNSAHRCRNMGREPRRGASEMMIVTPMKNILTLAALFLLPLTALHAALNQNHRNQHCLILGR